MAFSAELGNAGFTPTSVATTATVTFEPVDGKPTVSSIHLDMTAKVPGIDAAKFQQIAEAAKQGCPISRLLKTNITLSAKLES
jgi:osmotically inducible protein OsmC